MWNQKVKTVQILVKYNNLGKMVNRKMILLCLLMVMAVSTQGLISFDFEQSEAVIYLDQGLTIKIRCSGGSGVYSLSFKDLPYGWKVTGNNIVVTNFSPYQSNKWRLKVEARDTAGLYVSQTIMISFIGYYVSFTPVTLPVTGTHTLPYPSPQNSSTTTKQQSKSVPPPISTPPQQPIVTTKNSSEREKPGLNDLIGDYPGLSENSSNSNSIPQGFGIDNSIDPSIVPNLIATTQVPYNSSKDSKKPTITEIQRDAALRRQANANKAVANLIAIIQQLTANVNVSEQDLQVTQTLLRQILAAVQSCDLQLYNLENIQAKIKNAISDRESKVGQYKKEIKESEQSLSLLQQKLKELQSLKQESELESMPNSITIQRLQISLNECQVAIQNSQQIISATTIEIDMMKEEKKLLLIEVNEAKQMIEGLKQKLSQIRAKIAQIQKMLTEARQEEKNIIKEITHYEQIPNSTNKKVSEINQRIEIMQKSIERKQNEVKEEGNCDSYRKRMETIQKIIHKNTLRYEQIISQIERQKLEINKTENSIAEMKRSANSLPLEITSLANQLYQKNNEIRRVNYLCEDKRNEKTKMEEIISRLRDKYNTNSEKLKAATAELEKARIQQELAKIAVDEMIAILPNTTPFPIIPSSNTSNAVENSTTPQQVNQSINNTQRKSSNVNLNANANATTPSSAIVSLLPVQTGKLPSSFAIGQSPSVQFFRVGDPKAYLLKNYGFEANNSKMDQNLYRINAKDRENIIVSEASTTLGLSTFICDEDYYEISSGSGVITDVGVGTITAKGNGIIYQLTIGKCTKAGSTSPLPSFSPGTPIFFEGVELFSLSGSVLYNAYVVISVP